MTASDGNQREARMSRWLGNVRGDVRYAARTLAKKPGFTLTAVLSLAIGIGASAALFSLVDQVLLRLLPVKDPERLVLVDWRGPQFASGMGSGNLLSYPLCRDLQAHTQFFAGVFCRFPMGVTLVANGQPQPVAAELVSGTYFPVLGVQPALGRLIGPSDDLRPGDHPVIVLSYDYWRTAFNRSPDVIGRTVLMNNYPMTIIGVAEPAFYGIDLGQVPSVWMPAMMAERALVGWTRLLDRRMRWMNVFARLAPGVTQEAATAGLQPWFTDMLRSDMALEGFPKITEAQRTSFLASTIEITPGGQGRSNLRNTMGGPLWVLMAGTLLLHLLASANVASLFLARGAARVREMRTRMALGASRARVAGLLVVDSVIVALLGGAFGLLLAPLVAHVLISFLPQNLAGVDVTARIDARVLGFACAASLLTGTLCALGLAWQAARTSLIESLRERAGQGGGVRMRKGLVIGQMAFTLILLVGAGLFVHTLARLYAKGAAGMTSASHLLTFGINVMNKGLTGDEQERMSRQILATLRALPEVENAGISGIKLLEGGSWNQNLTIEADARITTNRVVHLSPITPGLFATLGTQVVAGRDFDDRDARPIKDAGERSVIVNERFARRYFGDSNPIGRRIGLGNNADTKTTIEIVGVVRDFSYRNLREETEQAFFPLFEGSSRGGGWFYLKVRGRPEQSAASVRAAIAKIDPTLPLLDLRSFAEQMDRTLTNERMLATLSAGFGVMAMLISVIGLFGVMSFLVTSRTREIGVRLALGATRASAVWRVVRDAGVMVGVGAAIALPCLWGLRRFVQAQLFGIEAIDAGTIAAASAVLLVAALAGALVPAWRAASIRPTEALRAE